VASKRLPDKNANLYLLAGQPTESLPPAEYSIPQSKPILQRQLKLAIIQLSAGDLAKGRVSEILVRIVELGRIERVKCFGAKLERMMLAPGHAKHFHEGEIQDVGSGPDNGIAR
jgi:hypothetical protein